MRWCARRGADVWWKMEASLSGLLLILLIVPRKKGLQTTSKYHKKLGLKLGDIGVMGLDPTNEAGTREPIKLRSWESEQDAYP